MNDQGPLLRGVAARAVLRCAAKSLDVLARRTVHLPRDHVGVQLRFADGTHEWDGPERAEFYARCLWRILELGCEPDSIHYVVLPGLRRDAVLREPRLLL